MKDIAGIYVDLEKYDLAVKTYLQAIFILPSEWKLHFDLAELYEEIGQMDKALEEYKVTVDWHYDEKADEKYLIAVKKVKELSD